MFYSRLDNILSNRNFFIVKVSIGQNIIHLCGGFNKKILDLHTLKQLYFANSDLTLICSITLSHYLKQMYGIYALYV